MRDLHAFFRLVTIRFVGFAFYILGGVYLVKMKVKKQSPLIIFNYHSFSRYNNYRFKRGAITQTGFEKTFEKQLKFIQKHFELTSPESFFESRNLKNGLHVFLTFDDGYKDNYEIAFPLLKKYKVPAAFFIVTSLPDTNSWLFHDQLRHLVQLGKFNANEVESALKRLNCGEEITSELQSHIDDKWKDKRNIRLMMKWSEIRELQIRGFTVGSHTHNHRPLLFLNEEERRRELEMSKELLATKIDTPVKHFSYPNGLHDEACKKLLAKSGYDYAYTTKRGANRQTDNKLELKRIGINASDSIGQVLLKTYLSL